MSSTARKTPQRPPSAGPNPAVIIGVVVGVLVLAVIGVIVAMSGGDGDDDVVAGGDTGEQYGIVTVQGEPLPTLPDSGDDPAVGEVAPNVRSERSTGQVELTPAQEGRPTMAVFLAHWCPHCQAELPLLVEMAADGAFDGVRTVAVVTGTDETAPNYPPAAWLDQEGWEGSRLYDDEEGTAARAYGLSGYPMLVFMDAEGRVVERVTGEQPREVVEAALEAAGA